MDIWLRKNKLSLNYTKTNYIIYDKQPNKVCDYELKLTVNNISLTKVNFVKYLGVYFDNRLSWNVHIDTLTHHISRCSGFFCRLRRYVPRETLCLLYYSLIYSRLQYGILTWGTASKSLMHFLEVRINRIVRILTFSSIYTPINNLYKSINVLKLLDIYNLELGKFMYQLYYDKLPVVFTQCFNKIKSIHYHMTRQSTNSAYFLPRVNKSIGHLLLGFRGIKHWNSIECDIRDRHWVSFKKLYKLSLVQKY